MLQLILRSYRIPVLGGTLADLLLIIVALLLLINQDFILNEKNTVLCLLPFFIYILFNIIITWHTEYEALDQIIEWVRTVIWYYIIIFGVKKYFDISHAYKVYETLAIIATLFIIIQYVSVIFFNHYISGFFGPLSLRDSTEMYRNFGMYSLSLYRPNSFFSEPAHYATFIVPYLCLNCLGEVNLRSILIAIFLIFGILLSGSTTGLIMCGICVFFWLFIFLKEKKSLKYFLVIAILVFVSYRIISKTNSYQFMVYRTFGSDNASQSRLQWFLEDIFPFNSIADYLFGVGNYSSILIDRQVWLPGWALLFQGYGIIGMIIYVGCSIALFIRSTPKSRSMLVAFWILGIGAEVLVDQHIFYFLPFVIIGIENRETK